MLAEPVDLKPELKIVSFNLGLLRVRLFGREVKSSPPHVAARFKHIPAALAQCGADVVFLQEIYEDGHVAEVVAAARAAGFEHHARAETRSRTSMWRQFHNGLLVLSKVALDLVAGARHAQSSTLEKVFGCKACLLVRMTTPVGKLCFVNMHTTAGGGSNTESPDVDAVRGSELLEAVQLCAQAAAEGYTGVIVGDLNCGPEASAGNYEQLKALGFTDALESFGLGCTWDQASPLNTLPIFAGCPSQRIDHLFLSAGAPLKATSASRCFTDACVDLPGRGGAPVKHAADGVPTGKRVTLSDHYGVRAVLTRK